MSAIKGHASQGRISPDNSASQNYVSVVKTDPKNRAGLDVLPKALYKVSSVAKVAETLDASSFPTIKNAKLRIIKLTGHTLRVGDIVRFSSGTNIGMEISVGKVTTDEIFLEGELLTDPDGDSFFHTRHITLTIDEDGNLATTSSPYFFNVVDGVDGDIIDISSDNIPASSSGFLEIVSSLAADVKKIQVLEDIGEFIGLYTGAASSETFLCLLPQGFTGSILDVELAAGTRLSVRNMKDATISTDTRLAINFMG